MAKPLRENPTGIFSLMLTPYNEDKTIDWATYEEYCDWQVEQSVEHLFAVCGSSEMTALTLEERLKLATLTAKHKGDTTIVASANIEPSWFAQVEEIKKMSQTERTIFKWFKAVIYWLCKIFNNHQKPC